ncbi:MAG TPA: hypothetical protein VL793_00320 [Patescibacteria group bacterium]|nr:hypothetical protein [Patescibacteria group bacterium]
MMRSIKARISSFAVLLLPVLAGWNPAQAQSTAFTYQGRLNFNGAPVSGNYDFQFAVYDSSAAGALVAGPITLNSVSVTVGLFVARMDFGAGVFTGPARWLQISFRPSGNGNFTTLDQRLELTSSPYAIRSQAAGVADALAAGSVVKSLNGLHDDVTLAAGANVTLTPNGNTITLSAVGGAGGGDVWSVNANNAYYTAGNVGIGTSSPEHRLGISGGPGWTGNGWTGALSLDNGAAFGWKANTGGQRFGLGHTDGGFFLFRTASDPGTTTSAATYDFSINDSGRGSMPGGLDLAGEWDGNQGALTLRAQKPTIRLNGGLQALDSDWLIHVGSDGPGDLEFFNKRFLATDFALVMALNPFGNVGIGTADPQSMLDIVGQDALSLYGYQPFLTFHDTENNGNVLSRIQGARGELFFATDSYMNNANRNSWAKLDNAGNWSVATLTIRGGADLAEPFDVSSGQVQKGAVMVIDADNPGRLKVSQEAYDHRVAGVVSGAGGIHPGISLHQESVLDGSEDIALSGRVYAWADAATGEIQPGDLLTTSATPGHAMRAADAARRPGAILGKAMTGLKQGRGLVLVLVTLE